MTHAESARTLSRIMRLLALLGLALVAVGCTEHEVDVEPYRLWVSPRFSSAQQVAARNACKRWNEIAGRTAVTIDGVGDRERMAIIPHAFPIDGIDAQGWHAEHGVLLIAQDNYACSGNTRDMRCFEAIVIHEIGHLMGVPHVQHGVMQERDAALEFSDEDREACAKTVYCGGLLHPEND